MKYPTFFGIDLTSTEVKPSACLALDGSARPVYLGFLAENRAIIAMLDLCSPHVIAIDAPLSLPLGLCCLEQSCPCQPQLPRTGRQCEQELMLRGIPCYPTGKKTFIRQLVYRGMALKSGICREVKQPGQIIEVYPFASRLRLFGRPMPSKTNKQGLTFLRDKLGNVLPSLKPWSAMLNHDLYDAALAAHTALLYHRNRVEVLGSSQEGTIVIPV